eukprot:399000_1
MLPITSELLARNVNFTTAQWKNAHRTIMKKAIGLGRVKLTDTLINSVSAGHFSQAMDPRLDDAKNAQKLLPWAVCKYNENHLLRLAVKITTKHVSFATSPLKHHPCYKDHKACVRIRIQYFDTFINGFMRKYSLCFNRVPSEICTLILEFSCVHSLKEKKK